MAHPIKHLTSPCLSLLTHTQSGLRWSVHIKVYQTGTTSAQPWPGLNPLSSLSSSLGRLCSLPPPPVHLQANESITQTRAQQHQPQSELSSFIARPRSLDCGFVPADMVSVAFARVL